MADQEHFTVGTINGTDVTIPEKQILGLRIYGATPGQSLIVDPGGFVKGGSPSALGSFATGTGTNTLAHPSTAALANYPITSQLDIEQTVFGPGKNLGNFAWTTDKSVSAVLTSLTRGIKQAFSAVLNARSIGDSAGLYAYVYADGGPTAPADEGATAISGQVFEPQTYFHGTVASTTGTGDTAPVLAQTSGSGWVTDGAYLLNISKGTISGNLNGTHSQFASSLFFQVPVSGVTLPLTTAWGTLSSALAYNTNTADVSTSVTVTVALGTIGGSTPAFTVGSHITIAGDQRIEQSIITAVGAASGGNQSITFAYRYPNTSAVIFQGGLAGQFISLDANLAFSSMRSTDPALGSLDGVNLIYARYVGGAPNHRIAQGGNEAATSTGANSGFHLYPGAEIVSNTTAGITPKLEPNVVPWVAGDLVECPHPTIFGGAALLTTKYQQSVTDPSFGSPIASFVGQGTGFAGGSVGVQITNANLPSTYSSPFGTGPVAAPDAALKIAGPWQSGILFGQAPSTGTINIQGAPAGATTVPFLNYQYGPRLGLDLTTNRMTTYGPAGFTGAVTIQSGALLSADTIVPVAGNYTGSLGSSSAAWQSLYAGFSHLYSLNISSLYDGFMTVAGSAVSSTPYGVTQNVVVGGSTLHITNGLITSVTTP